MVTDGPVHVHAMHGQICPPWNRGCSSEQYEAEEMESKLLKLVIHHAIFVGTTIVVCWDDGRRSSNDPHTPRDDRRTTRTHHAMVVGCKHDGRQQLNQIVNLADIFLYQ